jgi:hypothetical protein
MENKHFYKKTLVVSIFILAAALVTFVDYNIVLAQSTSGNQTAASTSGNQTAASTSGNQTAASTSGNQAGALTPYSPGPHSNPATNTPFNQSKLNPSNTETIKSFAQLNGNNTQFFTKDKSISNPHNNVGNSMGTNSFQSH